MTGPGRYAAHAFAIAALPNVSYDGFSYTSPAAIVNAQQELKVALFNMMAAIGTARASVLTMKQVCVLHRISTIENTSRLVMFLDRGILVSGSQTVVTPRLSHCQPSAKVRRWRQIRP